MIKSALLALLFLISSTSFAAVTLGSAHAIVIDEKTGEVLLEKNADTAAPIASMTKLMTAMVVLDAKLAPDQTIRIERADMDDIKGTKSGVPVGAEFSRRTLIELAIMSSDNRAAEALARTYPGGNAGFLAATRRKIHELGLEQTLLVEPTGLSAANHATAHDMAKIVQAASKYPAIVRASSQASARIPVNGRTRIFRNTNRFVGKPGFDISVSKTGFTNEAGRCIGMRLEAAGRKVLVVLMGAVASPTRALDIQAIHQLVGGEAPVVKARTIARVAKAAPVSRVKRV